MLRSAPAWSRSRSRTPASASRPRSRRSSSRRSSRPTPAPAANTAAPASGSRSAASCRTSSAAKSSCAARLAWAARSRSICRQVCRPDAPRLRSQRRRCRDSRRALPAAAAGTCRRADPDDRLDIEPGDTMLLIVEDDPHYARILVDLAHDEGFKVLVAMRGADALDARRSSSRPPSRSTCSCPTCSAGRSEPAQAQPAHAAHPGADRDARRRPPAWPGARRLLVHHQAGDDRGLEAALTRIKEYAQPRRKRLLVVEDNAAERMSITRAPRPRRYRDRHRGTGAEALSILRDQPFDCVVLDLRLPDMSGFDVLEQMRDDPACPTCRWSCSRAGNFRPRRSAAPHAWRGASW